MTLHSAHGDPEVEHVQQRAEALAGELYEAREKLAALQSDFDIRGKVLNYTVARWLEAEAQRNSALDWAEREQSHRLDIEGSDRLLRSIEAMDELQHGGDAA